MGGSLAGGLARLVPWLQQRDLLAVLMAGVAAGFGGVFGTPVAGTIFALEVLSIGCMRYGAIVPCMVAAIVSDQTCRAWGIVHTHYSVDTVLPATLDGRFDSGHWWLLACAIAAMPRTRSACATAVRARSRNRAVNVAVLSSIRWEVAPISSVIARKARCCIPPSASQRVSRSRTASLARCGAGAAMLDASGMVGATPGRKGPAP
jgi:hypothetical protein